ncbi:MAG: hypothetical protein N4A33_06250 [Bacteriovoracaceae bacterium]|jgi:hypothetical protein|nr:hypothetical protein [Bacteriovoracaceae bacterium]
MAKVFSLVFILSSVSLYAQAQSREEFIKKFMEQRQKIMKQMMDSFNDDSFFSDDAFFDDDLINQFNSQFKIGHGFGSNVIVNQKHLVDGSIEVKITPKSKDIKLDIETTDDAIIVKSKTMIKEENNQNGQKSFSSSSSVSSQSIGIPYGYKASAPKAKGDSVIYLLSKRKPGKKPVKMKKGDKTI